ncbi:O-antigen ligase family protein [Rubripirellula reticaptiva]|uniref:O-antigen ligase family protein n=1 Tax=Rubripirellula reticaptiva TaxID=2528013 RepID=UPI001645C01F|nr:O-antigen ligase family protein [Rubripirellula reticaptiva]
MANDRTISGTSRIAAVAGLPAACFLMVAIAAFFNTVDINAYFDADDDHLSVDWPVMVKLAIAGICGIVGVAGVIFDRSVRRSLMTLPGIFLVALAAVFLATSVVAYEETATISRAAAIINVAYLCFVPTAISILGLRRLMIACLIGMVTNLIVNWGMYLFWPAVGVFEEELGNQTFVNRMGGLGHPNAIARTGVLSSLLSLAMLRGLGEHNANTASGQLASKARQAVSGWSRLVLLAIIGISLLTMAAAYSRSGFAAGFMAAAVLMIDRLFSRAGILISLSAVLVLSIGFIGVELLSEKMIRGDSVTSMVTKTGEIDELTSATGRTEIWGEAIRLIRERPLTGWGLNSTPKLMADFSLHTHNLLLHVCFSGGLIAGLLILILLGWNLFYGVPSPLPIVRSISTYVLVSGIFEDTVLDTFASPSTIWWFVVLLYPAIEMSRRASQTPRTGVESDSIPAYT